MRSQEKRPFKRIAFILSLCVMLVWLALGTGASLAWFSDSSEEVRNIFHMAEFELDVSYRLPDGRWKKLDGQTGIFDDNALYEPGYMQVVYLKVENKGSVPFRFKTAVSVTDYTVATNVFGQQFLLRDYLKFGIAVADSEAKMENAVKDRASARNLATSALSHYAGDATVLKADETVYMAIVVGMPEEVGNEANYRGETVPMIELGVIVKADQIKN